MLEFFFSDSTPDSKGRRISEILSYNNDSLENIHDYIQWLFPLPEISEFNVTAPILTTDDITAISANHTAISFFNLAIAKMIAFYSETHVWAQEGNHNLLRITRILRSTTLILGCETAKHILEQVLKRCTELNYCPSVTTMHFWENATEPDRK
jgi:hypothetical protein